MEANQVFYKLQRSMNPLAKVKIIKVNGENVSYKEMQGYREEGTNKRVFVSEFSLIENYKREVTKSKLTTHNVFKYKFLTPLSTALYSIFEEISSMLKSLFLILARILSIPFLPLLLILEVIQYKKILSYLGKFQSKNKDETEYLKKEYND